MFIHWRKYKEPYEAQEKDKRYVIAIAGPSGGGKSEICQSLKKELQDVLILPLDDSKHLRLLRAGQRVSVSALKHHHKSLERAIKIFKPASLIILEGFLALYNQEVRDMCDGRIFIDVPEALQFKRRIKRQDNLDETYIKEVAIPNYKIYSSPTRQYADYVIDGRQTLAQVKAKVRQIIQGNCLQAL